jgi:hypothetical protein
MFQYRSLIFVMVSSLGSLAIANTQDIFDIIDLADQVKLAARTSTASSTDLQEAKNQLKEVLRLLNQTGGGSGGTNTDCINFAYSKYYTSLPSNQATQKAVAACKLIKDLPTAEFLYIKLYQSLPAVAAMDEAASRSGTSKIGKLDMLQFAFNKYFMGLSSQNAAVRASDGIDKVPRGRLNCLQTLFNKYYASQSSTQAMDQSLIDCQ